MHSMVKTLDPLLSDPNVLQDMYLKLQEQVVLKEEQIALSDQQLLDLNKELKHKEQSLRAKDETISHLLEQLALLRSKRFQSQSEQLKHLQGQLFDEAELEVAIREVEETLAEIQTTSPRPCNNDLPTKKEKPRRKPLPAHLKRIEIVIDVSPEDKQMMADDWVLIGYEESEQLAVQQRQHYVKRYKCAKYVRKEEAANLEPTSCGIKVAPAPRVMLPRALADGSLLADVLTSKFVDAVSFYRTEKALQRDGIDIGYSTLCQWPIQLVERLEPLKSLMMESLQTSPLWHLDETTLQVLNEPGREARQKSHLWAIRAGPANQPVVLFHYHPRRHYEALESWLAPALDKFAGVMVTDEHKPYNRLRDEHPSIQGHGGCWAHCRRKFADAAKGRKDHSEAHKMLILIAALYRLESGLSHLEGDAKTAARAELVAPQLEKIKLYLDKLAPKYPRANLMHKAIYYAQNNWGKLTAFLDHPVMPLDNNPIERAIRPFTLGRRNWLFAGSPRGASASAFIYSLVETAKANGWEPRAYLQVLFERYPQACNDDERRALLPMNLKPTVAMGLG
jgi:transposase